ncbi:hypothetical protein K501DRAFT_312922 [Backusella circina FSU 941]|nr:hypothetical protein K501DRAFT_312922 [Backusella circina FSU 941]
MYESIFILLPRKTKLECSLVCRRWTHPAQQCLLYNISIVEQRMLDKLMNMIEFQSSKRRLVKHFALYWPPLVDFDKRVLCFLFPNLQSVSLVERQDNIPRWDFTSESLGSTMHLKSKIKHIYERGDYEFTLFLIKSNLSTQLEQLKIIYLPKSGTKKNPIRQLKNMPALKKIQLGMAACEFGLEDCERMHLAAPSLEDFTLDDAILVQNTKPFNSTPAPFVNTISWTFEKINHSLDKTDTYIECLIYTKEKYNQLTSLDISLNVAEFYNGVDMVKVFDQGWLPLLQRMGPQLKSLKRVDVPPQVNIFKILDDLNCRIESLSLDVTGNMTVLDDFIISDQSKYMRYLYIGGITIDYNATLKETTLVKLCLPLHFEAEIHLNRVLQMCPDTLRDLSIINACLDFDEEDTNQYSITTLNVRDCFVKADLRQVVKKFCPNLSHLYLLDDI